MFIVELEALKNKVSCYQEAQNLDSEEKEDLYQALKLIISLVILPNSFKILFQKLSQKIKSAYEAKLELSTNNQKLQHLEQKYHSKSRVSMTPEMQRQIA